MYGSNFYGSDVKIQIMYWKKQTFTELRGLLQGIQILKFENTHNNIFFHNINFKKQITLQLHYAIQVSENTYIAWPCRYMARVSSSINQGPLKKWTEHSHELHLLTIHSRGLLLHPGAGWGLIFWIKSFNNPKKFITRSF